MGKDKREWRKLVKKLRRKRKRQFQASLREKDDDGESTGDSEIEVDITKEEPQLHDTFFLSQEEWLYRDEQTELDNKLKKAEKERLEEIEVKRRKKIREEWEAKLEQEQKIKEEKERLEKIMKEKQEAEFDEFLSFLSGDIETPPTKYLMPETINIFGEDDAEACFYYGKTAACRFYDRCTKMHPRPTLSTAILIPNFFSHFKLEQLCRDEYDSDLGLEYEDKELYKEFLEFYDDVVPELRKFGTLIQFKVCCNLEPHLRGNVYIQYQTIRESVEAFRKFNGRFYNGKQLSLQFIKMKSWRSAICGSFLRKACPKGRTCCYLHVFRNPTKEFVRADHDWKDNAHTQKSGKTQPPSLTNNFEAPDLTVPPPSASTVTEANCSENGEISTPSSKHLTVSHYPNEDSLNVRKHSKAKHRNESRSHSRLPNEKRKKKKSHKEKKSKKSKKHKKHSHKHKRSHESKSKD